MERVRFDRDNLEKIPRLPGVYLMKDAQGKVLYVGKSKNLKSRLNSYFRRSNGARAFIPFLLKHLKNIEVVVTDTELEALILENTLIKKYSPRYNVAFRDDKAFLYIRIGSDDPFPRIGLTRRPGNDDARYFGPYPSSSSVRQTLRFLQKYLGLRTCKNSRPHDAKDSCRKAQIGYCAGVCRGKVSRAEYAERIRTAVLFLEGKSETLLKELREKMQEAVEGLRFEAAARIRDQISAIERTLQEQHVSILFGRDQDVVGMHRSERADTVVVLQIRQGNVWESLPFSLPPAPLNDAELLFAFLNRFYGPETSLPHEILIPTPLGDKSRVLARRLKDMAGRTVKIRVPRKGRGRAILEMAQRNADYLKDASGDLPES